MVQNLAALHFSRILFLYPEGYDLLRRASFVPNKASLCGAK